MGAWPKFSIYSGSSAFKESLPTAEDNSQNVTDATDPIVPWIRSKTAELDVINITVRHLHFYLSTSNNTNTFTERFNSRSHQRRLFLANNQCCTMDIESMFLRCARPVTNGHLLRLPAKYRTP
jgi:hypothetical protein